MSSKIKAFLLGEPSGWPTAVVMFSGALTFLGMYVYFGVLGDSSTRYELFLAGAFALSGTAESLPKKRRRMAAVLRITAILIPLIMITILIIAPEMINPR
jgi:hypothetical protein